jgi:hypothetical protein
MWEGERGFISCSASDPQNQGSCLCEATSHTTAMSEQHNLLTDGERHLDKRQKASHVQENLSLHIQQLFDSIAEAIDDANSMPHRCAFVLTWIASL